MRQSLKKYSMSEINTFIAEPSLEVWITGLTIA